MEVNGLVRVPTFFETGRTGVFWDWTDERTDVKFDNVGRTPISENIRRMWKRLLYQSY